MKWFYSLLVCVLVELKFVNNGRGIIALHAQTEILLEAPLYRTFTQKELS
jgi:hypothetical protein